VFLSYASQDAEPARKICDAMRAAGIEVWFDQSELRGGDAWDQKIRQQIHDCRLFIALISAHTEARDEGYFRREWKLAVDRTHDMLDKKAFLFPAAIDATSERGAAVPDKFHEVQWTRLPGGEAPPEFVARVNGLLSSEPLTSARFPPGAASDSSPISLTTGSPSLLRPALSIAVAVLALAALAYLLINKPWISKPAAPPATSNATASPEAPPDAFRPPSHSIAVLPFVNMSGDKEQDYFSDGLSEELLNSLARINELQVAAGTSSFYFKGEHADLGTIARKLNVASILEGSVRRSGQKVRITAQLNNAVTGFRLWSETYDRDLGDVLELQAEIADAVTGALKIKLLGGAAEKVELGETRIPAAFDAYLRGLRLTRVATNEHEAGPALDAYAEAIRLDPNYALAYAARSLALSDFIYKWGTVTAHRQRAEKAGIDAEQAIALAPGLGLAHAAMARFLQGSALDYPGASEESERALALAPGNATVLYEYSLQAAYMGRANAAIEIAKRGVTLDPLNLLSHRALGDALWFARRYNEAIAAYQDAIAVDPGPAEPYARRGLAYYVLGSMQMARSSCEMKPDNWESHFCLALIFEKLGQRHESDAQIKWLKGFSDNALAYQFAQIYAQRGEGETALEWLDTALRLRDPGFRRLKTDPLMDPLRKAPRFQAIERELKFPSPLGHAIHDSLGPSMDSSNVRYVENQELCWYPKVKVAVTVASNTLSKFRVAGR
jgi:TolB-like protein